ncbi:NADPH:quinone oxidoreductase family protein [Pontixanthobacter sp.]|uniref:NADPH:quinone oxidoreductase family protein n=1 Tax=Pontixanthobacter sp. TaxID=2792078 RepID=UPI003C7AEBE5
MQALQVTALSSDFSGCGLVDASMPIRKPGEVLVRVHAASLNFPDLLMTRGAYQFKPEPPFIAGMELAGEVMAADRDSGLTTGQRVMGGAKTGGMAEFASLPARHLRAAPEALDYAKSAALGAAYTTAYTALVELGDMQPGQWVLIHGASGGVALAAVDLAKSMGAKVIAATGSPEKIDRIAALYDADAVIESTCRFREQVAEITGDALADLVLDPVGGDIFDESTRCVAFGGKLLIVGFASGRIADLATNIPLIKGFSVVGVRAGEYARRFPDRGKRIADTVSALANQGAIDPAIDRTVPLSQWRNAFEAMDRRELVGKVVLKPGA